QPCTWTPVPGASGISGDWDDPYRTWQWVGVTDLISNNADFRVSDAAQDDKVYYTSEDGATGVAAHIMKGQLNMQAHTSSLYHIDDDVPISWTKNGSIGNLVIEYSAKGDFTDTLTINGNYPCGVADAPTVHTYDAGAGAHWKAPAKVSENFEVRVRTKTPAEGGTMPTECQLESYSPSAFKVRPFISAIGSPLGGANWYAGDTTRKITWTARSGQKTDGSWPPVKIDYKTSVTSYDLIDPTATGLDCFNGTGSSVGNEFTWPLVPDEKDFGVLIMISFTDYPGEGEEYAMPASFNIKPKITLGGEIQAGDKFPAFSSQSPIMTFTTTGSTITSAKVYYDLNSGVGLNGTEEKTPGSDDFPFLFATIDTSTGNGPFNVNWASLPDIDGNLRIRVADADEESYEQIVFADTPDFATIASISLIQPMGDITWLAKSTTNEVRFNWTGSDLGVVNIYYDSNNGDGPDGIPDNGDEWGGPPLPVAIGSVDLSDTGVLTTGTANYLWNPMPSAVTNNGVIKLELEGQEDDVKDDNNTTFRVGAQFDITDPESGSHVVKVGEDYYILWNNFGITGVQQVALYYTKDNTDLPLTWEPIVTDTANDGSYKWDKAVIPGDIDTLDNANHQIKIVQNLPFNDNVNVVDYSDDEFPILGRIEVTSPDTGDQWGLMTTPDIKFKLFGELQTVDIYYYYDYVGDP
ncbi:hypothetical protein ACFL1D_06095, partial [Candidatus Omnitrophota bacterium]